MTCSIGISWCKGKQEAGSFSKLYKAADEGLYQVKKIRQERLLHCKHGRLAGFGILKLEAKCLVVSYFFTVRIEPILSRCSLVWESMSRRASAFSSFM